MISSSKELERAVAHRQTWASHSNVLMFADVNGTEAGFIAHPQANGPSYQDAQHRTTRGLQYAVQRFPDARCAVTVEAEEAGQGPGAARAGGSGRSRSVVLLVPPAAAGGSA